MTGLELMNNYNESHLRLDVVVVDFNTAEEVLRNTLRSLATCSLSEGTRLKLLLVDNGDRKLFLENLACSLPLDTVVISGHGNVGFAKGNNLALENSNADFVLILNPDVVLNEHALEIGLSALRSHEHWVAVFPHVRNPSGVPEYLYRKRPRVRSLLGRLSGQRWFASFERDYVQYDLDWSVQRDDFDVATGCFMLIRKSAWNVVNGFDPRFFLFFEDYDLTLRLKKLGHCVYLPQMSITHRGGNVASKRQFSQMKYFFISAVRFFNKHGWQW